MREYGEKKPIEEKPLITCPSDGTGIKWEIVRTAPDGTIFARAAGGQQMPSIDYPTEIKITPEAKHGWKIVK